MHYYIYPSTENIGSSVLLEITSVMRDEILFAEFDCDDAASIILNGQSALFSVGFDTSNTVITSMS